MHILDFLKINKICKKTSVKSEKTQEKLGKNSRILAKNSKGGSLRLLKIAPKTLKKKSLRLVGVRLKTNVRQMSRPPLVPLLCWHHKNQPRQLFTQTMYCGCRRQTN